MRLLLLLLDHSTCLPTLPTVRFTSEMNKQSKSFSLGGDLVSNTESADETDDNEDDDWTAAYTQTEGVLKQLRKDISYQQSTRKYLFTIHETYGESLEDQYRLDEDDEDLPDLSGLSISECRSSEENSENKHRPEDNDEYRDIPKWTANVAAWRSSPYLGSQFEYKVEDSDLPDIQDIIDHFNALPAPQTPPNLSPLRMAVPPMEGSNVVESLFSDSRSDSDNISTCSVCFYFLNR